jgi:methylated-DNA-[protein]-cysteine S-methyltransferase
MVQIIEVHSPIGELTVAMCDGKVCAISFDSDDVPAQVRLSKRGMPIMRGRSTESDAVADRLRAYFDGALEALDDIAVDPAGTPFQQRVWSALREVPARSTISYSDLAARIGSPSAVRAVGAANGANPIPLVIPCHRVIGAGGALVGYGGGIERKRWLLAHEGAFAPLLPAG